MYYRPRKTLVTLIAVALSVTGLGLAPRPEVAQATEARYAQVTTRWADEPIDMTAPAAPSVEPATTVTPTTTSVEPTTPPPATAPIVIVEVEPTPAPVVYTVKRGDTLTAIAKANNQSLAELLSRNPQFWKNPSLIQPGQQVRLTGATHRVPDKVLAPPSPKTSKHSSVSKNTTSKKARTTAHTTTASKRKSTAGSNRGAAAVSFALAQVGKPYVWGGEGPNSYDCSGLTQAAWRYAGVSIPRTVGPQWRAGQSIPWDQMKPGDLLISNDGHHVAMYVGNGQQVEAANPRQGIGVHRLGWSGKIIAVVRPIA